MHELKEGLVVVLPAYKYGKDDKGLAQDIKLLTSLNHNVLVFHEDDGQEKVEDTSLVSNFYYDFYSSPTANNFELRREAKYLNRALSTLKGSNIYNSVRAIFILLDQPKTPIDLYTEHVFEEFTRRGASLMSNRGTLQTGGIDLDVVDGDFMLSPERLPSLFYIGLLAGEANFRIMLFSCFGSGYSEMPKTLSEESPQPKTKKIQRSASPSSVSDLM